MYQTTYLSARYAHPLDRTIRYKHRRWHIRWYVDLSCMDTVVPSAPDIEETETLERYFNGYGSPSMRFLVWWNTYQTRFPGIRPLRTEMILRSDAKQKIVGIANLVLLDTNVCTPEVAHVHVLQYTTSLVGAVQLNLYQYLLETFYRNYPIDDKVYHSLRVIRRTLVVFPPDGCPVYDITS